MSGADACSDLTALVARMPIGWEQRRAASLCVLDWIGCAIAGAASPAGRTIAWMPKADGAGHVSVIGRRARVPAQTAAFANAWFADAADANAYDPVSGANPLEVVVPAACAAAGVRTTGVQLLDAILGGVEIVVRAARAFGPAHAQRFHASVTAGPMGAAYAAGVLGGLNAQEITQALRLALSTAGGVGAFRHQGAGRACHATHYHFARAAETGLEAAILAQDGAFGPVGVLEGPHGVLELLCPDPNLSLLTGAAGDLMVSELVTRTGSTLSGFAPSDQTNLCEKARAHMLGAGMDETDSTRLNDIVLELPGRTSLERFFDLWPKRLGA